MGNSVAVREAKNSDISLKKSGFRWGSAALAATSLDFMVLTTLKEIFHVHYVWATFLGAVAGALVAFLLGRNWAFLNTFNSIFGQAGRYLITVLGSIALNTGGVFALTEGLFSNHYLVSKIIVAICVGLFFNFPMQRYFVFVKR